MGGGPSILASFLHSRYLLPGPDCGIPRWISPPSDHATRLQSQTAVRSHLPSVLLLLEPAPTLTLLPITSLVPPLALATLLTTSPHFAPAFPLPTSLSSDPPLCAASLSSAPSSPLTSLTLQTPAALHPSLTISTSSVSTMSTKNLSSSLSSGIPLPPSSDSLLLLRCLYSTPSQVPFHPHVLSHLILPVLPCLASVQLLVQLDHSLELHLHLMCFVSSTGSPQPTYLCSSLTAPPTALAGTPPPPSILISSRTLSTASSSCSAIQTYESAAAAAVPGGSPIFCKNALLRGWQIFLASPSGTLSSFSLYSNLCHPTAFPHLSTNDLTAGICLMALAVTSTSAMAFSAAPFQYPSMLTCTPSAL